MGEQFRHPGFFKKEIATGPLHTDEYGEGAFTVVANLENLPESIRGKVHDGYVVKQYKDRATPEKLFPFDSNFDTPKGETRARDYQTLLLMARKLQARQRLANEYFGKELPDFVVPSQFIVGTGQDGIGYIYEVQKKIGPDTLKIEATLYTPTMFEESVEQAAIVEQARIAEIEQLAVRIRSMYQEKLSDIKQELDIFISLAESLPDRAGWFPDIASGNFLFTNEGLRYIDTNHIVPLRELEQQGFSTEAGEARDAIGMFLQSLRDLSARL